MILRLLIISSLAMTTHFVQAQSLTDKLNACRHINASQDRLACYDRLVPAKPANKVIVTKTSKPVISKVPIQVNTNTEFFGQEHKLRSTTPDRINVQVVSTKKSLRGKLKITLKNGQEWHQSDSSYFKISKDKQSYIKKGALGSFYMGQEGRNRTMKVKRIK